MYLNENEFAKPRFVHVQRANSKYNGMTIAYTRNDDYVWFSYALCCKPDQYNKAKGRDVSTDTYLRNIDKIIFDAVDYPTMDMFNRVGYMPLEYMIKILKDSVVGQFIADHEFEHMTMMSFKHAAISQILVDIVEQSLDPSQL
jgi:hypothetical protein